MVPSGWALAVGPSGPPIAPPRPASAENFNPYHDLLGRFTTSDGTAGPDAPDGTSQKRHLGYTGEPTGQDDEGKTQKRTAQKPTGSIASHPSSNNGFALCVVAVAQTLIATKKGMTNPPNTETIKAQITAAAKEILTPPKEGVNWNGQGVVATPEHLAAIVQKVLENNGVQTIIQPKYDSAKALSDALVASQQPAMINLHRAGTLEQEEHAVTAQWDPNKERFLVNNIGAKGGTQEFTRQQFERGKINASILEKGTIRSARTMQYTILYQHPITSLKGS